MSSLCFCPCLFLCSLCLFGWHRRQCRSRLYLSFCVVRRPFDWEYRSISSTAQDPLHLLTVACSSSIAVIMSCGSVPYVDALSETLGQWTERKAAHAQTGRGKGHGSPRTVDVTTEHVSSAMCCACGVGCSSVPVMVNVLDCVVKQQLNLKPS